MLGFKTVAAPSTSPLVTGAINDDENSTKSSLVPLTHSFKTQRTSSTWFSFQVFRKERSGEEEEEEEAKPQLESSPASSELPERYDAYLLTKPTLVLCSSEPSSCIANQPLVLLLSRNLAGQVFVVQQTVKIDFRCT